MTNTGKSILAIVIVAIIGVGVWKLSSPSSTPTVADTTQPADTTPPQTTPPPAPAPTPAPVVTDNSDASITSDMNSADTQMSGLNSDSANMNQGSDVPPAQ